MDKPIQEGIKDFLRIIALAIIPVLIAYLQGSVSADILWTAIFLAALKGLDKYLHKKDSKFQVPF